MVLYGQFEQADKRSREFVASSIRFGSWMIAQALLPVLDDPRARPTLPLDGELARFASDGTVLKLILQPKGPGSRHFFYVGSAPKAKPGQVDLELDSLAEHGIVQQLEQTCTWDENVAIHYVEPGGKDEILTSVIPIKTRWGCWVLVSSHVATEFLNSSIARPYWQSREVRIAATLYLVVVMLGGLIVVSVWRSVRQFRHAAREARHGRIGEHNFAGRNVIPELKSVAADFDGLVQDLHRVARDIRQTAEDNAHSFKTPVATIQSSLEPLRKLVPADNDRGRRAIELIDSSLNRLRALVSAAQRIEENIADLIMAPHGTVNVTEVLLSILKGWRDTVDERGVRLHWYLDDEAVIRGGRQNIEVIVENILDNAVSFAPEGSIVAVRLARLRKTIELTVDDSGPGIDPQKIGNIFDRYFSVRPHKNGVERHNGAAHAGLGLWIVRQNVERLNGQVTAVNRVSGGLSVRVTLPIYQAN